MLGWLPAGAGGIFLFSATVSRPVLRSPSHLSSYHRPILLGITWPEREANGHNLALNLRLRHKDKSGFSKAVNVDVYYFADVLQYIFLIL